MQYSISTYSTE